MPVPESLPDPSRVQTRADLGRELSLLRQRAGLSVRELAQRVDVPVGTVGGYLSARHLPAASAQATFLGVLAECGVTDPDPWISALVRARQASDKRAGRPASPYPGLEPFQAEDADNFFGREESVRLLGERLLRVQRDDTLPPLLAVVGASGSGKSSLLRAGLVASARAQGYRTAVTTPGEHPLAAIEAALTDGPGLLVVDQFEEIFTACADPAERTAVVDLLTGLDRHRTVAVLGLRADFYAAATRLTALVPTLQHAQVVVAPLTADEVRAAVVEPARRLGVHVEDGLVDLLLRDLAPRGATGYAHDPGSLPLLSHALLATWSRGRGTHLTSADYEASGGIRGAIQQTAEEAYASLSAAGQQRARRIFRRLANVGDDAVATRRRVAHDELDEMDDPQLTAEVVDLFVDRRLLTAETDTLEVSHEALFTSWERLRGWLEDDRAGLRLHRQLTDAAEQWGETPDDESLLRGGRLEAALEWAGDSDHGGELNRGERAFLERSAAHAQEQRKLRRRRTRRLQQLLVAVAVLAVLAAGLAVYALRARSKADAARAGASEARDEALSRQIALESARLRPTDPDLAAQLAVAGYRVEHTSDAESALLDASAVTIPTRIIAPEGATPALDVSPNGAVLAASCADGKIHLWSLRDPGRPRPLAVVTPPGATATVFAVRFSPDGHTLAYGGGARQVNLVDVRDPAHPVPLGAPLGGAGNTVFGVAFAPHRPVLAAASADKLIHLWNLADPAHPRPAGEIAGFPNYVQAVAYSPDGSLLAGAGADGTVRVWDVRGTPRLLGTLTAKAGIAVFSVAFSLDGSRLAFGSQDHELRIATVRPLRVVAHATAGSWINAVAFSPDGSTVAAGSSDSTVRLVDASTGAVRATFPHTTAVTSLAYLDHGSRLATAGNNGIIRIWPTAPSAITGATGTIFGLSRNAAGTLTEVGAGGGDNAVRIYDTSGAPRLLSTVRGDASARLNGPGAISPDGATLVTSTLPGPLLVWDVRDPAHPRRVGPPLTGPTAAAEYVGYNDDGTLLVAACDDDNVYLWDTSNPQAPVLLARLEGFASYAFDAVTNPRNTLLVGTSADDTVRIWSIADRHHPRLVSKIAGFRNYVYAAAFTPDGKTLITTSADKTIRVYDVSDPAHPHPLTAPLPAATDYVIADAISPDGTMLATASTDGTGSLWDIRDRRHPRRVAVLDAYPGQLYDVIFGDAGATVSLAGAEGVVHTYAVRPAAATRDICAHVGAAITKAEWAQYVPGAKYAPPCG